ncbi:MAG: nuclear transport factor 2 family protein [Isosphaerales bacterium]
MQKNLEVVEAMYQCFRTGDMKKLKEEVFAPDVTWTLPGRNPIAGTKEGADEVLGFFGALRKAGLQVTPLGLGEVGSDGVAEVYRGHGEVNGVKLDAYNVNYYKIRNGKIAEVQVFMADQHGYDAFCWAAFKLKPIPERLA